MKEGLDYKETAGWKLAEHLERLKEFERRNRPRRGGSRGERSVPPGPRVVTGPQGLSLLLVE